MIIITKYKSHIIGTITSKLFIRFISKIGFDISVMCTTVLVRSDFPQIL